MTAQPGELVTLARYTNVWEAHILKARLEAEGIFALVADQHLITADWFYSDALGGARVQVPASRLGLARQILAAVERGDYALDDESGSPARVCPRCAE